MKPCEFSRLAPALRTKAITIGLSFFEQQEAAEDVAQEALIRLWKAWDTLPSPKDAEQLAVSLAKRECVNLYRKEQRRPHTSLSSAQEQVHPASHSSHSIEENELAEAIRQAAHTLPRTEARLWRMFAEAGMKAGEISLITDINVRSVSSMLSHARKHIFKILKEGGYIDE